MGKARLGDGRLTVELGSALRVWSSGFSGFRASKGSRHLCTSGDPQKEPPSATKPPTLPGQTTPGNTWVPSAPQAIEDVGLV